MLNQYFSNVFISEYLQKIPVQELKVSAIMEKKKEKMYKGMFKLIKRHTEGHEGTTVHPMVLK